MIPKKQSEIVKQVSFNTNISEELIDDAVSFYYKELRKQLTELEDTRINVPKLGVFFARKTIILKKLAQLERVKDYTEVKELKVYHAKEQQKLLEIKLKALIKKLDDTLEEKRAYKLKKYEPKDNISK